MVRHDLTMIKRVINLTAKVSEQGRSGSFTPHAVNFPRQDSKTSEGSAKKSDQIKSNQIKVHKHDSSKQHFNQTAVMPGTDLPTTHVSTTHPGDVFDLGDGFGHG